MLVLDVDDYEALRSNRSSYPGSGTLGAGWLAEASAHEDVRGRAAGRLSVRIVWSPLVQTRG